MRFALILLTTLTSLATAEPQHPALPFKLEDLKLVDQVDFSSGQPGHELTQLPADAASYQEILGRNAMVLKNKPGASMRYAAFRLGKEKGLVAGKPYVLVVDYPEDLPRTIIVRNHGAEATRGFHTGPTLGDGLVIPYVYSNPESIHYPLSRKWKQWVSVFHLHDRFSPIAQFAGKNRPFTPKDGFHVMIAHLSHQNSPLSEGPAVGRIALYEAPDHKEIALPLSLPPKDLPQRYLFYREEMADGVISDRSGSQPGVTQQKDWFEYHARLMTFLGINTFSKDLLEFGANQGWSPDKHGGYKWMHSHEPFHRRWPDIIDLAEQYNLNVLPYYEYCGTKGPNGYGSEKRCKTLYQRGKGPKGRDDYTHIAWTEPHNADVTDPETYDDFRKILDCTITPYSKRVNILGAWIRTRNSQLPISFSNRCLSLYGKDTGERTPTRPELIKDKKLYKKYLDWWFEKRKEFLIRVRDFLRGDAGTKDGIVLFTTDASEGGVGIARAGVVTDTPALWKTGKFHKYDGVVSQSLAAKAQMSPRGTWGGWEWQHSIPPADPHRYKDTESILMSYGVNRLYTVSSSAQLELFRQKSGLAMIRHYVLNENAMQINKKSPIGYYVSDLDVAGPYHMLAEARGLAYGDPRYIGYLSSALYSSGFPQYARAFNQAFLSLPAIPSTFQSDASSNRDVMVRQYPTKAHGTWYAVVNVGLTDVNDVTVALPETKSLSDAITKKTVKVDAGKVTVSMYPGQVLTWHAER